MNEKQKCNKTLTLFGLPIVYPNLAEKAKWEGTPTSYGVTLLLDKNTEKEQIARISTIYRDIYEEHGLIRQDEDGCVKDGDKTESFYGNYILRANNSVRPHIFRNAVNITDDEELIEENFGDGTIVTAHVRFWLRPSGKERQVRAVLNGLKWTSDGERIARMSSDTVLDRMGADEEKYMPKKLETASNEAVNDPDQVPF